MNSSDYKTNSETGAVLILAALVFIVLISMVALGIDSFRGFSAQTEKKYGSDYAALSALSAYLGTAGNSHSLKVAAAVTRAEQISSKNRISADDNRANFQTGDSFHVGPGAAAASDIGVIRFGRWWNESPATCSLSGSCPCGVAVPCFQECPASGPGCADPEGISASLLADAVSVSLQTKDSRPMDPGFASIMGLTQLTPVAGGVAGGVGGSSIATIAPKHTVFAIDLSRFTALDSSTASDSYNPVGRGASTTREYAYKITASNCSSPPYTIEAPFAGASQTGYECVSVIRSGTAEAYLVANQGNLLAQAPQPHTTMLNSLLVALNEFVIGAQGIGRMNRLAVIGFDQDTFRERMWGGGTAATLGLVRANNIQITNLITSVGNRAGRLNSFLFPRPSSVSDTPAALKLARDILKRHSNFNFSVNSVVLLTNGMTSCDHGADANSAQSCLNHIDSLSAQLAKHYSSLNEIYEAGNPRPNAVTALFQSDKIHLHTLYFGRDSRSHTVLVKNPASSACMGDYDLRNRNFMNVVADTYVTESAQFQSLGNGAFPPTNPRYSRASQFFYAASGALQGVWGPIRPACSGTNGSDLIARCATQTGVPPNLTAPMLTVNYNIKDNTFNPDTVMDSMGRVLCEQTGENEVAQVVRYFREILNPPSLLLVE